MCLNVSLIKPCMLRGPSPMAAPMPSDGAIHPALSAAGFVGTWDWSVTTGDVVLDPGSAKVVAGDATLAGQVIDLDTALARIHADDRVWVLPKILDMAQTCGSILAEYRVQAPDGSVRWLLDRGRVSKQPDGTVHGRGIWLDVTEIHANRAGWDNEVTEHPLEAAADHCLMARDLLRQNNNPMLRLLLDMALLELGRDIARHIGEGGRERSH